MDSATHPLKSISPFTVIHQQEGRPTFTPFHGPTVGSLGRLENGTILKSNKLTSSRSHAKTDSRADSSSSSKQGDGRTTGQYQDQVNYGLICNKWPIIGCRGIHTISDICPYLLIPPSTMLSFMLLHSTYMHAGRGVVLIVLM